MRHLIMGQIITTQNLVAIKEVRHAGQSWYNIWYPTELWFTQGRMHISWCIKWPQVAITCLIMYVKKFFGRISCSAAFLLVIKHAFKRYMIKWCVITILSCTYVFWRTSNCEFDTLLRLQSGGALSPNSQFVTFWDTDPGQHWLK